ncbi:MAG TPA: hypothetical protein VK501_14780 [Baekduia sp.]|uniref:hypothetical protein n=1 Tax=Baekduia sp. TaxID=2600305 RepID=UPI002CC6EBA1|nr:hypothetical protein [Baekduia sp.]HMJ35173.1 hypothetical protein [Baekduia sp.]
MLAAVLGLLGAPMVRSPREGEWRTWAAVSALTMFDDDAGTTIANVLRMQAGGDLPELPVSDPVEEAAAHLARDTFVALLPPVGERSMGSALSPASISRNPWSVRFQEAVLADSDLGQLFTGPPETDAGSFSFMSTTGHGEGGVQLALLGERILSTPAAICRAHQATPTQFVAAGIGAVSHMRRLVIAGRTVRAPALLGFDGISVPPETHVDTPWGHLRAVTAGERELTGTFPGSGNAVLEVEYPVKLYIGHDAAFGSVDSRAVEAMRAARADLEERARMIALAVLLAEDVPLPAGVGLRYTLIEDPFGWMPAISGRIDAGPRGAVELSAEQVAAVGEWLVLLEGRHHGSMSVAVRRTLSAHERFDSTDAFIDALIAWDGVFGARSGDAVTFRVALGFALVLGGTEPERREIKRRAQELYALRSDLVHGSIPELPWKEAGEHREQAVRLLMQALRVLYRDHPRLLSSQDRTGDLVLRLGADPCE